MTPPDLHIAGIALREAGLGPPHRLHRVGGGDVAQAFRVEADPHRAFLKLGAAAHPFEAEALALEEIAATRTLRVPRVLAHGVADGHGYLLLEWIDLVPSGDWVAAGRQLAALHGHSDDRYGWPRPNAIGASPQPNTPSTDWAEFYRERRLRPQFALARTNGLSGLAAQEAVACRASDALLSGHAPPASVLHGDLWRGNLSFDCSGVPVVFDPATYHGDAETDLAMTRLFGGFAEAFYRAYADVRRPAAGERERLPLYELYHLLNHANLFGGGYVAQAIDRIGKLERRR